MEESTVEMPKPEELPIGCYKKNVANRGANGGTCPLPRGKQWVSHKGFKQRLRAHKQVWAQFEKLARTNGYARATRERLLDYVTELNVPGSTGDIVAMSIVMKAKTHADASKASWATTLNQALNELEQALDQMIDPSKGVVVARPPAA